MQMEAFTWGIMQIKDSQRVIYFLYKLHMVFPSKNKIQQINKKNPTEKPSFFYVHRAFLHKSCYSWLKKKHYSMKLDSCHFTESFEGYLYLKFYDGDYLIPRFLSLRDQIYTNKSISQTKLLFLCQIFSSGLPIQTSVLYP